MSASAGDFNPYTTTVESFKLFDPKIFWKNTGELVKDRNAKGKKEGLGQIIAGRVSDLIHTRAEKTGEELSAMNSTHLMNQIAAQDYYIRPTLSKTEELLTKLQQHFA